MPFTAALGLLTAWLLDRQRFPGRRGFEFLAMMSFAIPGTVIGVCYILAFNVPPVAADRHRHDHRDRVRVPQHAGGHPRRAGQPEPDRPQPGRGVADAGRALASARCGA